MVQALGNSRSDRWLEPCVGAGALLQALSQSGVHRKQITGLDLDPKEQSLDRLATVYRGVEFLSWSASTNLRFDKIIANPPYIAIERLQQPVRRAACKITALQDVKVTAGGNTWYAFLCAAINLLRPSGDLCFLLPAAWDFANYAAPLRQKISQHFEQIEVHRSRTPLFHAERIQDGAVVLVARRLRESTDESLARLPQAGVTVRKEYQAMQQLVRGLAERSPSKQPRSPDINLRPGTILKPSAIRKIVETEQLGKVVSIGLGGVTGDAKFFLLSEKQRLQLQLPLESLRPVVTRAKHLTSSTITKDAWEKLRNAEERVWLFDPTPALLQHPAVRSYITKGEKEGACNIRSHKISIRSPWYRTPLPPHIDGFLSGMSKFGPWISFRKMKRLAATNTLYVVYFPNCKSDDERAALALCLLTSRVSEQLERIGRRYADGLLKFEPGDLRDIRIEPPAKTAGAGQEYRRCIAALLAGEIKVAHNIADTWQDPRRSITRKPKLIRKR